MDPRVAIIGAGVAGLSAARRFLTKGYSVSIFEARDRIGGRVQTADALPIDLGASFIHGTGTKEEPNSFMEIFKEAKGRSAQIDESALHFNGKTGRPLPEETSAAIGKRFWDLFEQAIEHSKNNSTDISVNQSLHDYFTDCLSSEDASFRTRVLQYAQLWGCFVGTDIRKQSLKYFYFEQVAPGETEFVTSTYRNVISTLGKPILSSVQLDTEVLQITSFTNGTQLKFAQGPPQMFDYVLITVPLGCLKHRTIAFSPPLPNPLQRAIDSVGYGNLEKVYFQYPSTWWSKANYTFLSPTYDPNNKEIVECMSLAHLGKEDVQSVLLFFVYEPVSSWLGSKPPLEEVDRFFSPYLSRIPGYDTNKSECRPSMIGHSTWSSDKLSGYGSYSNFQIGQEGLDQSIQIIREALPERNIWFAGEHVPPKIVGIGTVNCAFHSGKSVADRMIEKIEKLEGRRQ